jgi:hypothetical protein
MRPLLLRLFTRRRGRPAQLADSVYLYLVMVGPSSADKIAGSREDVDRALARLARKHMVGEVAPGVWAALVATAPGSRELRVVGRDG